MDITSYIIGYTAGESEVAGNVTIDGSNVTCTDDGEGNITITEGGSE